MKHPLGLAFAATITLAGLALGTDSATAQTVFPQGAVAAALGAPAAGKVTPPPAPQTAAAGKESAVALEIAGLLRDAAALPEDAEHLAERMALLRRAIELGASAQEVAAAAGHPRANRDYVDDVSSARYYRGHNGLLEIAMAVVGPDGRRALWGSALVFGNGAAPPEGLDSLPALSPGSGLPMRPQELTAIGRVFSNGGSAEDAANGYLASEDIPGIDASGARFVQSPYGPGAALAFRLDPNEPPAIIVLPDTEASPALASLPISTQAFPVAATHGAPLPDIPAAWLARSSPNAGRAR